MTRRRRISAIAIAVFAITASVVTAVHFQSRRGIIGCGGTRVDSDLSAIVVVLRLFRQTSGRLPTEAEGLNALVVRPSDVGAWTQLFRTLPTDPWARPYQYRVAPDRPEGFDLFTLGPDATTDSDDIHFPARQGLTNR